MKSSTQALLAVLAVGAIGGTVYLVTRDKAGAKDLRQVVTQQLSQDFTWSFSITQKAPDTGLDVIIFGPEGNFATSAAALTAGQNWLAANPVV